MTTILQAAVRGLDNKPMLWRLPSLPGESTLDAIAATRASVADELGPKFKGRLILVGIQGGKA